MGLSKDLSTLLGLSMIRSPYFLAVSPDVYRDSYLRDPLGV